MEYVLIENTVLAGTGLDLHPATLAAEPSGVNIY